MPVRLSIRAKMTIVIALLLTLTAGLGLLAVRNMRAINANAVDIQSNWLPSVRALAELRSGTINYRNIVRKHLLAETPAAKAAADKRLEEVVQNNTRIRQSYEKLITSPEERAIYTEWSQQWDAYKKGAQEVLALSRDSSGKIPHEANDLNETKVNDLGKQADDTLEKDIDLNNKGADAAGKASSETYETAFMLLAIILGVATVLDIGIGN
jgi:methyl-accepting chemotaxis protein